jgi:ribosomal protein L11 methyltransferase
MRTWPALLLTMASPPSVSHPEGAADSADDEPLSLGDRISAALDGIDVVAIEELAADLWRVSFRESETRDDAIAALTPLGAHGLRLETSELPDDDWARRSQAAIQAIRVGRIVVAPPWDAAATTPNPGDLTIVIEPGMGFGSGHHATTRLCLRALDQVNPQGRTVLDIGTGSGVLAIAAVMLGATSALGVDVDPDALENADTNAGLNGRPAGLAFQHADFRIVSWPPVDIVLANLTGGMLAASATAVLRHCRAGGVAILSGITAEEGAMVTRAFAEHATIEWQAEEDGWVGLVVRPSSTGVTRRQFLGTTLAAGAGCVVHPERVWTAPQLPARRHAPAERPLRVAFIGIGHRGVDMIKTFAATRQITVAALCDVDLTGPHTQEARRLFPTVPCFTDFRALFDRTGAEFDAAVISTPDHSHFPIAAYAISRGTHVYVEKPLAQSFREVDLLMALAARSGVVTQMGNQGHSGNNFFQFKAWTEAGVIKDVTKVVAFMNSERRWHGWTVDGFPAAEAMPAGLDWDGWHAARPMRAFSTRLHPENWRSWFAYGDGAFGDWGPHILDTTHRFLRLGMPHTIEAVHRDGPSEFIFPQASTIRFDFAARGEMPPVEVFWYDGAMNRPPLPAELGPNATLTELNGKFIYSKTHVFKGGTHGDTLRIIPETRMQELAATLPRIGGGFSDHVTNFIRACQGTEEARSPFSISGPLTQVFLLGVIAQRLGGRLAFDTQRREFRNHPAANALLAGPPPRKGWEQYYV